MSEPTLAVSINALVMSGITGLGVFFVWLLKRSIYGRLDELKIEIDNLQTRPMCALMQTSCQKVLKDHIDMVQEVINQRVESLKDALKVQDGRIELILTRQMHVINRIDKHLNGHGGERE